MTVRDFIDRGRAVVPGFVHVSGDGGPCERCGETRFRPTDSVAGDWSRWYEVPRWRQCIPLNPDTEELTVRAPYLPRARERLGVAVERPSDDQMWTPHPVRAPNPFASREERERARREALLDVELARAMLLDIRDAEKDPTSPINFNPMRNMLARLCRSVLRAYNQPDPTKE